MSSSSNASFWLPPDTHLGPPRRILVCGSREWTDRTIIRLKLATLLPADLSTDPATILHGKARGADEIAGQIALDLGFWVEEHPADWKAHGKAAGPIRNREMLDTKPDLVLAFQRHAKSPGTQDCVREAKRRGIPTEVYHHCGFSCHYVGGDAGCIYLEDVA